MTKTYPISDKKLIEAKNLIRRNGGTISADDKFEILGAEGSLERNGELLTIRVTKKPFFASWKRIENKLDGFFH